MFYPFDLLKKGGRFHLCWIADSWPSQFRAVTHQQLMSHDIREVCDDLHEVMESESRRPSKRFSLRLSSKLLCGLVKLHQKKTDELLKELCMLNATIERDVNRGNSQDESTVQSPSSIWPQTDAPTPALLEEPEEQQIEEIIQDGFGDENDEEMMMVPGDAVAAQLSAIEITDIISVPRSCDCEVTCDESFILQEAGLADTLTCQRVVDQPATSQQKYSHSETESSETQLGSLDRTKVSLGESAVLSYSQKFIMDKWGTEATMMRIIECLRDESRPLTVATLLLNGPSVPGYKRMIEAKCFTSILRLKQHGFITIKKSPGSTEMEYLELGTMFT